MFSVDTDFEELKKSKQMSFSSHFGFSFWPTKLEKYYVIVYLLYHYFYFCLTCLALQNAKTEHMEMKISQPIFGIFDEK